MVHTVMAGLLSAMPILSVMLAGFSIWLSWRTAKRQKDHLNSLSRWDEYKETVYDPLRTEIRTLYQIARDCRRHKFGGVEPSKDAKLLRDLALHLNELSVICQEIDSHEATEDSSWAEFSESESQEIHDSIANGEFALDQKIQKYIFALNDRLRAQRNAMVPINEDTGVRTHLHRRICRN